MCEAVADPYGKAGLKVLPSPGSERATRRNDFWNGEVGSCYPDLLILDADGKALASFEVEAAHERGRPTGCTKDQPCRDSGKCTVCQWRRYAALPGDDGGPNQLPFHLVVPEGNLDDVRELLEEEGLADKVTLWTWKATEAAPQK